MSAFDITLYGHLSFDNIYEDGNYRTSVGCIGNVWSHLKLINPDLKVKVEPTDVGESLIIIDRKQCKRTSISHLSLKTRPPTIHDSRLSHIMYINELADTNFIRHLKGYVTADTCNGKPLNVKMEALNFIDILLISDEDVTSQEMLKELIGNVREYVVVHRPEGSTIYAKNGWQRSFRAEIVPDVNVLGAGDKFAAYIISGLDSTISIDKVIHSAHVKLTEHFKSQKI